MAQQLLSITLVEGEQPRPGLLSLGLLLTGRPDADDLPLYESAGTTVIVVED